MPTQNSLNQLLALLNFYQHAKIRLFQVFIFEIQSILESWDQTGQAHFWPCPPKNVLISFKLLRISISIQKVFIPSAHSSDAVNFRVPTPEWPHQFLTKLTLQILPFNLHEFVPACKKISWLHLFILDIQSILESRDQIHHTYFWPCPTKIFSINF